jgi:hypothetical protein
MSNNINNGGPAFPCDRIPTQEGGMIISDGMTLRDYFAAKALQGLLSHNSNGNASDKNIAEWAYSQADAMLRARGEA